MRVVFLGSPEFALPSLQRLRSSHEVVGVVTQPDRQAGRGHSNRPPPVKAFAEASGLPVVQPEKVSDAASASYLQSLKPDVIVVAAYGQILRQKLLDVPALGALNVHASLLPRWRGASPISAALLAGDPVTGVTIMEMVRALDAGPIIAQATEPITDQDTSGSLEGRLATKGADLLEKVLEPWANGELKAVAQVEAQVTYAGLIKRGDAVIEWSRPAAEIWRQVRAFNPWPGAFTWSGQEEIKVWESLPMPADSRNSPPGTILEPVVLPPEAGGPVTAPLVQTGLGALALIKVQPAGRRPMSGSDLVRGRGRLVGSRLESPA